MSYLSIIVIVGETSIVAMEAAAMSPPSRRQLGLSSLQSVFCSISDSFPSFPRALRETPR